MKYPLLIVFCIISLNLSAQQQISSQDSIKTFYDELFSALKRGYLHRKTVDWKVVEPGTRQNLMHYSTFKNSLNEIRVLFDKIGANHSLVYDKKDKYAAKGNIIPKENYGEQWKKKYDTKPGFEVKVLDEKYGYILIPGMVFFDVSKENIHKLAQPLYDQIARIKSQYKPKGWIIDLRFNTGGNSTPMLLSLYDFLGDNDVWTSLNVNKKRVSTVKMKAGSYFDGTGIVSYINPNGISLEQTKVAVIIGATTASSGEVTALSFKGRANTIFIGEPTPGFTTGNIFWPLPFDIKMALTTSYDADRKGIYHERIIPDIRISDRDNFDDLLSDKNIQEAIKFINDK